MRIRSFVAPVVGVVSVLPGVALAAVPASVTTALGDAATDVAVVAGLGLVVFLAAYSIKVMRRGI